MAKEPEGKADEAETKEETTAPVAATPSKTGMLIVIIVGFLVMVLTPLITVMVVKMTAPGVEKKHEEKKGEEKKTTETVYDVDPVIVNIDNTQGTRYLKIAAHLVLSEPKLAEELKKGYAALVKDRIITAVGNKTIPELEGEKGRETLKREIQKRLNDELNEKMAGTVLKVYFSEYLIQ